MKTITIPTGEDVDFPDDMSDEAILQVLRAKFPPPPSQGRRDVTPFKVDVQQPAPVAARPAQPVASAPPENYTDAMGGDSGSAIMAAATPAQPGSPGLIARVGNFLRPEPKSVLENYQPTPEETQATVDRRLAMGAGPISQDTMAKAELVRASRGTPNAMASKDTTVNRVVQALDEKEPNGGAFADLAARANNPANISGVERQKAEEFRTAGEWAADTLSALGQGATSLVQLPTAIIAPGSSLAKSLQATQDELQGQESDVLKAQRKVMAERVLNEDGFLGKYFATVQSLVTNPALGLSEATKQVPNFLGVLGAAKIGAGLAGLGVSALEKASPTFALGEAISGGAVRSAATATGANVGGFTGYLAQTSGDAAQSTYARLTDPTQTDPKIWAQNPDYQKLIAEGKTRAEAIDEIATSKARLAAVITAPLAVFGYAGAEAAMVARGAGQAAANIATPKGAAKMFAKDILGENIEEGGTQLGSNAAIRLVDQSQKLLEGVPEAMATATVTSAPFSARTVQAHVQDALNPAPAFVNPLADLYARRALDVQSYDDNIITPRQQAMVQQDQADLQASTSAGDAATAADNLAGSLNEMLVPGQAVTPLPTRIEPTLTPGLPAAPTAAEPTLDLNLPPADQGLPAINPATEQQFGLDRLRINPPRPQSIQGQPVASLTDEDLTGIANDDNAHSMTRRSAAIELTARQAEQTPTAQTFTPEQLGKMKLSERRALSQNFDQTENEDGTTTFTAKPGAAATTSAAPAATTEGTFGLGAAEGRVSDAPVTATGDAARADLQARLNAAAVQHGITVPTLAAPAKSDEATVTAIGKALGVTGPVVAYSDANGADGFQLGGAIAINTKTQKGVAATAFHENHHIIEQLAAADTQAGRTNTPAQQYVTSVNGLFDDMDEKGKRAYTENFLHKDELASIADPVAREQRTQQLLSSQTLRSEMVADFMGNRATDRDFLADLAKADPKGFGGFVQKWIGILDNMLVRLRGVKDKSNLESVKVDQYLNDLNRAKMVARDAMVAFRNGTLQQSATTTTPPAMSQRQGEPNAQTITTGRGENLPGQPAQNGPSVGEYGSNPAPSYGTARPGAISVLGRHYSATPRQTLSGEYYGRGLKGAERTRLDSSPDPRLKSRVYFYVDQGQGVRPEAGVGGHAHETQLNNIYDPQTRLIKPQADANAFESAVINAGFDGYIAPFGNGQSAVVLLGQKHKAVPVRQIGQPQAAALPAEAAPTTLQKGLMSKELGQIDTSNIPGARVRAGTLVIPAEQQEAANAELARIGSTVRFAKKQPARVMFEVAPDPNNTELKTRWDAVPFDRKVQISQRVAEQVMPQVFKLAGVRAKLSTQLGGYLDDTSPSFAAIVPSTASAQQLMDVARVGGFGLAQDSMMVLDSKPFEGSAPTGLITVTLPENMQGQEAVHSVYQALRQVSPENISGHTTVGREMVLAVPSDKMADLTSKIVGVLDARPETFVVDSAEGHMAFPSKEEYDYGQQTGKLPPELSAKRAEANRIREEASAAIESELATDESAGGRQIDTSVYRNVADAMGLSQAEYNASALPLMLGGTGDKTFRAPNIGGVPEVVQWLDQRRAASGLATLDINKAEDRTTLAKLLAAEAVAAIRSAGNAVEWYDETVAKTLRIMAVKYPELNTDQNARNAFLMAVAISSQTMNVEDNLRYASSQYEAFRKDGVFPETGTGKSAPAMAENFKLANKVLADFGPEKTRQFLQTEFTKRELEMSGYSIGGESMDEKMLGSAVFGPKIGFGFYSNLTGNFEPVTMDMWFMRTVGRLAGTLPAFDPELFPKQVAKLRTALAETGPAERGIYADQFSKEMVDAAMRTDEGAIALARAVNSLHNRQFIKERAAFDSGTRIKSALVGTAGAILKSADAPKDVPSSGGERQRLRDVVRQMVDMVEQQTGKRVPPAALQALIWYPEQELYKKLGVRLRVTSQDYAGAAKSLLTKEGFDGKRISTAAESGPGSARSVAGQPNARKNGSNGGPVEGLVPLQGEERENFIRERAAKIAADAVKAQPLEDVFTGLDKRGLARTRAEAAFTARPDGARIKYVQENFHDILIELEDADKVEINCK